MIPWKLPHRLVVIDHNKRVTKKIARKEQMMDDLEDVKVMWKLNKNQPRVKFKE